MDTIDSVGDNFRFHFPIRQTSEYKKVRQLVTNNYGYYMAAILVVYLLWIPVRLYLIRNTVLGHFNLRKVNQLLNRYGNNFLKRWTFKLALNWNIIILISFWITILSILSLLGTNGDLIYLAKRLGKLSAVCLPMILFLTLRPSPLPHTLYLSLLPIHKWLSRLIIIQAIIHTILYLAFFNKNNTWKKAIKHDNLYGWFALFGFVIIIITSILNLRNRFYRLFFINHYFWTWIIVFSLQIHIRPVKYTWYTFINASILIWQIIYRLLLTKTSKLHDFQISQKSPNLSLIEFPRELLYIIPKNPGAHIRLTNYHPNPLVRIGKQLFPNYHPYTLVSLPSDPIQKLVIRMDTFKLKNNQRYLVSGSYDPHLNFVHTQAKKFNIAKFKIEAKRLLIVVGGSAISFALPILRVMTYHGIPVKVVWVIRDFRDVLILNSFTQYIHSEDFEIFITAELPLKRKKSFLFGNHDLEAQAIDYSLVGENEVENVDVEVADDESQESEEEEECFNTTIPLKKSINTLNEGYGSINNEISFNNNIFDSNTNGEDFPILKPINSISSNSLDEPLIKRGRSLSQKTIYSMNEQFEVRSNYDIEEPGQFVEKYKQTIEKLGLNHKVYKGRPKLNHRYRNWCLNEGFTQCSGPIESQDGQIICCRDIPQNRVVDSNVDTKDIWVVSAGPKGLVNNVKLWATENGLNFHEEAFYV